MGFQKKKVAKLTSRNSLIKEESWIKRKRTCDY